MRKRSRLPDRLRSTFESGSASISEGCRKTSVTEGMIFEQLSGRGIATVRRRPGCSISEGIVPNPAACLEQFREAWDAAGMGTRPGPAPGEGVSP